MPEIATQTDYRDIVNGSNAYLNLFLTFSSLSQNCFTCKGCNQRVKISFFYSHRKKCKLCKTNDYLNCR